MTKYNPAFCRVFLFFKCETHYIWNMKKGSKLGDYAYEVEITDLAFSVPFKASSNSLRELIKMIETHVPVMDTYSKVYREMRENVGVYIALFTMPLPGKKIRRVVVHITSANITAADIERFHARAAILPRLGPPDTPEAIAATIERIERLEKKMKPRATKSPRK
jgi:hypothetical protein